MPNVTRWIMDAAAVVRRGWQDSSPARGWVAALAALALGLGLCIAPQPAWAASGTWTNTGAGAVGYWTNNANWNGATYPGADGANQNAYFTNSTATIYTGILDTTIPNTIGTLAVSNNGGGQAWLVITNGVLTNTTLNLGIGGRLQVDSGGYFTNTSIYFSGTNGTVYLNTNGTIYSKGYIQIAANATGVKAFIISDPSSRGTWRLEDWNGGVSIPSTGSSNTLTVSGTKISASGDAVGNNTVAGSWNQMIITNGAWVQGYDNGIGGNNNTVLVTGISGVSTSKWQSSQSFNCGGTSNSLVVSAGGVFAHTGGGATKISGQRNTVLVTGTNSLLTAAGQGLSVGVANGSSNNTLLILAGGRVNAGMVICGDINNGGNDMASNSVTVSDVGSVFSGSFTIGGSQRPVGNSMTVSNGAVITGSGGVAVGAGNEANYNAYNVGGLGLASSATNAGITVGSANYWGAAGVGSFNTLTVTNATLVSGAATIGWGHPSANNNGGGKCASNNTATVTAGGYWNLGSSALTVGSGSATGNVVTVRNGGILEAGSLIASNGVDNIITNFGGVYQFNNATPTIQTNGTAGGSIFINGGVISFRGISSGLNLTNNTDATRLGRLTWSGDNTFRLNNSTATNTVAGGYTFQTGNPVNYSRLEMINGTTRLAGQNITIGGGGSVLFSNTTASIGAVFTNSGAMTVVDSLVTFNTNCVLQGGSILWATNAASSNLISVAGTLTTSGSIAVNATGAVAGKPAQLILIRASGAITDTASWTVTPSTYSVKKQNQDLILKFFAQGTVILLR